MGLQDVVELVARHGARGRPLRTMVTALAERPYSLAELVRHTAVPRRTVEDVLAAIGADLVESGSGMEIRADAQEEYRQEFQVRRSPDSPPAELTEALAKLIAAAPAPEKSLDHVAATPHTAAWRGLWLDTTYDLAGARLLCVGDHDLTSLAACLVNPELSVSVVDIDERILDYIDAQATRLGLDIRCHFADLRFGLPSSLAGTADLVFTDPPYTPEGVRLFLARGAAGLRDAEHGRLVMAYGYSERTPALGWKVQQAAADLGLVFEAILPKVNRYLGAQAVGSASDLYVCQLTARTQKVLERDESSGTNIYTHGAQSVESGQSTMDPQVVLDALGEKATALIGFESGSVTKVGLETVFRSGLPAAARSGGVAHVGVNLLSDAGALLLRVLLGVTADRMAILVDNNHPDIVSEASQRALTDLVGAKYRLRISRSVHGNAVVVADLAPATDPVRRALLDRAHGKIANVLREALIAASGGELTKNAARGIVNSHVPERVSAGTLLSLPRTAIANLLATLPPSSTSGKRTP